MALQPLLNNYTPQQILDAALETLGYPPTWQLSINDLLKVQQALIETVGKS